MCIRAPLIVLLVLGIGNSIVFEVLRHIGAGADADMPIGVILACVFLQLATHCICLKHSSQTDEDLYLSYKRVIEMVKLTTKFEKEKEASRMFINSVMPSMLAERVIGDMMREHKERGNNGVLIDINLNRKDGPLLLIFTTESDL